MDSDIHPFLKKILDNIKRLAWSWRIIAAAAVYSGVTAYQESQRNKAVSQLGAIIIQIDPAARAQQLRTLPRPPR
jgi:hypothetical protein